MTIAFNVCSVSSYRYDDQPVALFDEPALVRVPRTAHVLPAAPLAYTTLARAHCVPRED